MGDPISLSAGEKLALGIPPDVPSERVVVAGRDLGGRWCHYSLELVGCRFAGRLDGSPALAGPISSRGWPPDPPASVSVFGSVIPFPRLELVQMVVRNDRNSAWLEWRWEIGTTNNLIIEHGKVRGRRSLQAFRMGHELLDEIALMGRPFGGRTRADHFEDDLEKALLDLRREHLALTAPVLASYMHLGDRSVLRDNLVARCLDWRTDIKSGKWLGERQAARNT